MAPKTGAYFIVNDLQPKMVLTYDANVSPAEIRLRNPELGEAGYQIAQIRHDDNHSTVSLEMGGQILSDHSAGLRMEVGTLGGAVPKGNRHFHWHTIKCDTHDGYYHIKNDHTGHYLKATSSLKVKTKPTKSESAAYRWKFVLLEREDKSKWHDTARYIFQEGYKMIQEATTSRWLYESPQYRESYVELFEKMGRKKHVYP